MRIILLITLIIALILAITSMLMMASKKLQHSSKARLVSGALMALSLIMYIIFSFMYLLS